MTSKFRPKWQNFAKYGHTAPQLKVRLKGCGLRGEVESQKKYKKCYKDKFLDSKFNSIEWTAKELKEK